MKKKNKKINKKYDQWDIHAMFCLTKWNWNQSDFLKNLFVYLLLLLLLLLFYFVQERCLYMFCTCIISLKIF